MGHDYNYEPPLPEEQHERLVALRDLTSRGIPCILWGEDALNYVHKVPTFLFDQQILVPDELLEFASSVLQEGPYSTTPFTPQYSDYFGEREVESAFPRGILHLLNVPDYEADEIITRPAFVLLLPQSYFGLDVRSKERFQTLVPPLPSSNAGILAPKYHTFLEGLVAFNLNPPIPLETPHAKQMDMCDIFISYLLRYRVKYKDGRDALFLEDVLPEERVILSELQTEDARWYVGMFIHEIRFPQYDEIRRWQHIHQRALELYVLSLLSATLGRLSSSSARGPSDIEISRKGSPEPSVLDTLAIETSHAVSPAEPSVPGPPVRETSREGSPVLSIREM